MKFRTAALALLLAFGVTATMEAKTPKQPKRTYKAQKYKKPKFKGGKTPKIKHHA
jgi:hypothetical protein